jgi:hypothetical protein
MTSLTLRQTVVAANMPEAEEQEYRRWLAEEYVPLGGAWQY